MKQNLSAVLCPGILYFDSPVGANVIKCVLCGAHHKRWVGHMGQDSPSYLGSTACPIQRTFEW